MYIWVSVVFYTNIQTHRRTDRVELNKQPRVPDQCNSKTADTPETATAREGTCLAQGRGRQGMGETGYIYI